MRTASRTGCPRRAAALRVRSLTSASQAVAAEVATVDAWPADTNQIERLTPELIQEPDGGPTEDFVIPAGFQKRQKARQQGS